MTALDLGQIVISLLLFGTVVLMVWALFSAPVRTTVPASRQVASALGVGRQPTVFDWPIVGQLLGFAEALAGRFPYFRDRVWQDLEASGNPNGYTVNEYLALCLAGAVGLAIATAAALALMGQFDVLTVLVMPAVGFFVPLWTLREAAAKRVREVAQQLPYTLDLIALLLEAGANFNEAVTTVVRDEPHHPMNQELRLVQAEMNLGTARAKALQRL
ncbi:MAG: type II secretion system F family protein, partial [Phycisphaeraceae bacterium]